MIKKDKQLFYPVCDVCGALGEPSGEFLGAVAEKRSAGWESKRYRRDGAWYDVCRACLKEQEALHAAGKKNLFDIL
jgi:hypothetical protein